MTISFGFRRVLAWSLGHEVPAEYRAAPDVLGYYDYDAIPDELWNCLNCGEEWGNTFDRPCLSEIKKLPRVYFNVRKG